MSSDSDWDSEDDVVGELYWHYTNAQGLLGILRANALWASSAIMLNDSRELAFGDSVIREMWKARRYELLRYARKPAWFEGHPRQSPPGLEAWITKMLDVARETMKRNTVFVFCASKDGDSLSQWRGYAGQSGYAIGLRATAELKIKSETSGEHLDSNIQGHLDPDWRPVLYAPSEQQARVFQMVAELSNAYSNGQDDQSIGNMSDYFPILSYAGTVTQIKHPGFIDEREMRITVEEAGLEAHTQFRAGAYGITPYIELVAEDAERPQPVGDLIPVVTKSRGLEALPIAAIRVGPGPSADTSREGLRAALKHFQYGDVKVIPSAVPYR